MYLSPDNQQRHHSYTFLSKELVATISLCLFLLPYISLRFSNIPFVGQMYMVFLMVIFTLFLMPIIANLRLRKKYIISSVLLLIIISYGIVKGVLSGQIFNEVGKSAFESVGALFLFFIMLASRITTINLHAALITPILGLAFVNAVYTIYQFFFLNSYQELWFYTPLSDKGFELKPWNMIDEHGSIRAVGFFTSPLENAYLFSLVSLYYFFRAVKKDKLYSLAVIFYISVSYLTGVRTFFIGIAIALLGWHLFERGFGKPLVLFMLLPLLAITLTYTGLTYMSGSLDLSALDRLLQLEETFSLLSDNPRGYGFGFVGIGREFAFDSVYSTWFVTLGIVGGGILLYGYYLISKSLLLSLPHAVSKDEQLLLLTLVFFSLDFLYISQFQFALITPVRWFFVMASAIAINRIFYRKAGSLNGKI